MEIAQSLLNFTDMFYALILEETHDHLENSFVSPFSIYTALGMVLAGCEGNTKAEMVRAMQLSNYSVLDTIHNGISEMMSKCSEADKGVEITLGNRLFARKNVEIKEHFKSTLEKYYNALVEGVLFQTDPESAETRINQWVSEQTNGKIQQLIPPKSLTINTLAVVISTSYFRGLWNERFLPEASADSDFYTLDGLTINVRLMYNESYFKMTSLPHLMAQAVKIPFKDPQYSLLVILPNELNGLPNLLKLLYKTGGISSVLSSSFENTKLQLYLPKFKLTEGSDVSLKGVLQKMGINDAFIPGLADFSNITDSDGTYISDVLHKAILEVDEEGVIAAASTSIEVCDEDDEDVPEFRVDHQFIVSVVWNDTVPLFLGHITSPTSY
ncbi:unnamed protein product [Schistosoma turkestanicum]|nr:unnamed protein product [Schistosoma turkestanicum]